MDADTRERDAMNLKKVSVFAVSAAAALTLHADENALAWKPEWKAADRKFDFAVPGNIRQIVYSGAEYQGRPTEVFAWVGVPEKRSGKVPGIVLVHGGGGTAFVDWVKWWTDRGYAAIAMDTTGSIPLKSWEARGAREKNPAGGPTYPQPATDARNPQDAWTTHALACVIRGHSILRSLPEVDPDKTAVFGISWGGYLTCFAAARDPRFKAAVSVYGCGFLRGTPMVRTAGDDWLALFDPATAIASIKCPFMFLTRPYDDCYPWGSWKKSAALLPHATLAVAPFGHSHTHGLRRPEPLAFVDSILKGTAPYPRVENVTRRGNEVSAQVIAQKPITKAWIFYTADPDSLPCEKRKWQSVPAQVKDGRFTGTLPDDAQDFCVNVQDDREAVSTALGNPAAPSTKL